MARSEKLKNCPRNVGVTMFTLFLKDKCAFCRNDIAVKRLENQWRRVDVCGDGGCINRGYAWVGNKTHKEMPSAYDHVTTAPRTVEHKLTKKPNPVPKTITSHSRVSAK